MKKPNDRLLVSHEIPKSLFGISHEFNDYSYCLVHLCEKDKKYLQFYIDEVKQGQMVYLDNSAFELGSSVGSEFLLKYAEIINPTYVIAPDALRDGKQTVKNFETFIKQIDKTNVSSKIIAVGQGKDEEDFFNCYKFLSNHPRVDMIAIPYDIVFYDNFLRSERTSRFAIARVSLINRLIKSGYINMGKKHHLLGCSSPTEFIHYKSKQTHDFIYSIDTSCPIICTIFGDKLSSSGLPGEKRPNLLVDKMDFKFDLQDKKVSDLLKHNVETFKNFLKQDHTPSAIKRVDDFKFAKYSAVKTKNLTKKFTNKKVKSEVTEEETRDWKSGKVIKINGKWISYKKYLKKKEKDSVS